MQLVAIVTDGETWFGLNDAQIMLVNQSQYDDLCEGERVRDITPEKIVAVNDVEQCPGCGSPNGPCPNASCVREGEDYRWRR